MDKIAFCVLFLMMLPLLICAVLRCFDGERNMFSFRKIDNCVVGNSKVVAKYSPSVAIIVYSLLLFFVFNFFILCIAYKAMLGSIEFDGNNLPIIIFGVLSSLVSFFLYLDIYCDFVLTDKYILYYSPRTLFLLRKIPRKRVIGTVLWHFSFILVVHYLNRDATKSIFIAGDKEQFKLRDVLEYKA